MTVGKHDIWCRSLKHVQRGTGSCEWGRWAIILEVIFHWQCISMTSEHIHVNKTRYVEYIERWAVHTFSSKSAGADTYRCRYPIDHATFMKAQLFTASTFIVLYYGESMIVICCRFSKVSHGYTANCTPADPLLFMAANVLNATESDGVVNVSLLRRGGASLLLERNCSTTAGMYR